MKNLKSSLFMEPKENVFIVEETKRDGKNIMKQKLGLEGILLLVQRTDFEVQGNHNPQEVLQFNNNQIIPVKIDTVIINFPSIKRLFLAEAEFEYKGNTWVLDRSSVMLNKAKEEQAEQIAATYTAHLVENGLYDFNKKEVMFSTLVREWFETEQDTMPQEVYTEVIKYIPFLPQITKEPSPTTTYDWHPSQRV